MTRETTVHKSTRSRIKRGLDVLVSSIALVLSAPVIALLSIGVAVRLGRPVLFRQPRIGLEGEVFEFTKFRTMTDARDSQGRPLPDQLRVTDFGQALRKWSLDELPELLSVLKGDMSIVGPRPLLVQYRDRYSPDQWRRHEVRPGVVGPVTAYGRNSLDWNSKFELDVWYVDNWSLWLDLKLMCLSLLKAFSGHGVAATDHVTMPEFLGDQNGSNHG